MTAALAGGSGGDATAGIFDRDDLLVRLGGAGDAIDRIVSMFLDSVSMHFAKLADAQSTGDASGVRFHAHTIVGVAANVGAGNICSIAARIERGAKAGVLAEVPGLIADLEESLQAFKTVVSAAPKDEL
jgi:HPt (histidine-containing phosphotransfer) domain-containing protein